MLLTGVHITTIVPTLSKKAHKLTRRAKAIHLTKFKTHALSFEFFAGYDHTFDIILSSLEIYKHLQRFYFLETLKWQNPGGIQPTLETARLCWPPQWTQCFFHCYPFKRCERALSCVTTLIMISHLKRLFSLQGNILRAQGHFSWKNRQNPCKCLNLSESDKIMLKV